MVHATDPGRDWKKMMKISKSRTIKNLSVSLWCGVIILGWIASSGMANPRGASMKIKATVEKPDIIAVRIHHDMCPYCKQLAPEYKKLIRNKTNDLILYVTLDLSDEYTQEQAALMVAALGIEELWTGDLSNIGTVTFVDSQSKHVLSKYRANGKQSLGEAANEAVVLHRKN